MHHIGAGDGTASDNHMLSVYGIEHLNIFSLVRKLVYALNFWKKVRGSFKVLLEQLNVDDYTE